MALKKKKEFSEAIAPCSKITKRFFVGCLMTPELRMNLNQSIEWKHKKIAPSQTSDTISEVHYQGKDYLGIYAKAEQLSIFDLEVFKTLVFDQVKELAPKAQAEKLNFFVFSQLFIA